MWANIGRQSKARLAAIHSGCFYWHIRRFSKMSFYEPFSIFYATLTLWAYGFYTLSWPHEDGSKDDRSNTATGVDDEASDDSCYWQPTFIYLDRPNDDEMVQLFVRSGRPAAIISGVGDLCGYDGPLRVLREGMRLLEISSRCWGRTREYLDVLVALEGLTRSRRVHRNAASATQGR